MHLRRVLLTISCCLVCSAAFCAPRTWKDKTGAFSVEAELVEVKVGQARLKRADGKVVAVPVDRLSAADRQFLKTPDRPKPEPTDAEAYKEVTDLLTKVQQDTNVPALAGAIVTSRGLVAVGVAGVRKRGKDTPATQDDRWHLGSNTKAMTAALIARLVEQGQLKWDSTLSEIFTDSTAKLHPELRDVTVVQLLSHRSGLPANLALPKKYLGKSGPKERQRAVLQELAKVPESKPGDKFEYSNLGYIIAGAIVEKLTRKSWQENMREQIFVPLEMASVGFGGTGTPGKLDQPWSHMADGLPVPQNGPAIDNPPVMGPAGTVHCTIQDWSKFVADLLRGLGGQPALLKEASYERLVTPTFGGDYALGWVVTERGWSGGKVLVHNGSNTMNYATVWVAPQRDFAVLVCTNQGGNEAAKATDAAAAALIGWHSRMANK